MVLRRIPSKPDKQGSENEKVNPTTPSKSKHERPKHAWVIPQRRNDDGTDSKYKPKLTKGDDMPNPGDNGGDMNVTKGDGPLRKDPLSTPTEDDDLGPDERAWQNRVVENMMWENFLRGKIRQWEVMVKKGDAGKCDAGNDDDDDGGCQGAG